MLLNLAGRLVARLQPRPPLTRTPPTREENRGPMAQRIDVMT